MNRKVAGILLFLCLIVPIETTLVYLHVEKKHVRKEVKHKIVAGMDRDELVLLKFTTDEARLVLQWEHEEEFEYRDEMYDVVHRETKDDTIYFWCWHDHEETRLNRQMEELVENAFDEHSLTKEKQENLINFYKIPFIAGTLPDQNMLFKKDITFPSMEEEESTMYLSGLFHPPRLS